MKLKILIGIISLLPLFSIGQTNNTTTDTTRTTGAFIVGTIFTTTPHFNWSLKYLADALEKLNPPGETNITDYDYNSIIQILKQCNYKVYYTPLVQFLIAHCYNQQNKYDSAVVYYTDCISRLIDTKVFWKDSFYREEGFNKTTYLPQGYDANEWNVIEWIDFYKPYDAYEERANCKFQLQDYRGAINDENTALTLFKNDRYFSVHDASPFYANIAIYQYFLRLYQSAKINISTAIIDDNKNGYAYYMRGMINLELGLKEEACNDWSRAGELGIKDAYSEIKQNCQ